MERGLHGKERNPQEVLVDTIRHRWTLPSNQHHEKFSQGQAAIGSEEEKAEDR